MAIENILRRSEIFLGLDDRELTAISALPSSHQESFQTGDVLFKVGTEAKHLYILEAGQVNIVMDDQPVGEKPRKVIIDIVTKGGIFGWSALVKPHLYVLSAVCQSACQVAIIDGNELREFFESNTNIGYKVLQGLSQVINSRFRGLEQVLVLGKRWPIIEKLPGT